MQHIIDRFISYVTVDTESDPRNDTKYSKTEFSQSIGWRTKNIGMQDVTIDDKSYIMATLPSNVDHEVPTIGFVSLWYHSWFWSQCETSNYPKWRQKILS
jgi:tripeptide aminopeptidase